MNKIFILLFLVACNPISNTTNIESTFKPGLPESTPPVENSNPPSSYSSSNSTKMVPGASFSKGSQVSSSFEISNNGKVLKGNQIKASIDFNSAEIR